MVLPKDKAIISVSIDRDVKAMLEDYAKNLDITLSKLARNLIYISLKNYKVLERSGIINIARTFDKILEKIPYYAERLNAKIAKEQDRAVTISVVVDTETKLLLDRYSSALDLPLKIFARNLIYVVLQDYKLLKKVGLIQLAVSFNSYMEAYANFDETEVKNSIT